jgi:DNA modification methylase
MTARWEVLHSDCLAAMKAMDAASVDAVICDPPYGIGFMGRKWDVFSSEAVAAGRERKRRKATTRASDQYATRVGEGKSGATPIEYDESTSGNARYQAWCVEWATEALRVVKPGGVLVTFGGTRTVHRLACGLEDAGWIIRDTLMWLFGSGFPKSRALLKPAYEPIILARKPGPLRELGIDACRVMNGERPQRVGVNNERRFSGDFKQGSYADGTTTAGRWPSNVVMSHIPPGPNGEPGCVERGTRRVKVHWSQPTQSTASDGWFGTWGKGEEKPIGYADPDGYEEVTEWDCQPECPVRLLDEQSGNLHARGNITLTKRRVKTPGWGNIGAGPDGPIDPGDTGGASRFYKTFPGDDGEAVRFRYEAKASRAERRQGMPPEMEATHPTVKPTALCAWLCRLVCPPGGTILDPFCGSGSVGVAAIREGFRFIGIEREAEYVAQARARLADATGESLPLFRGLAD